MTYMPRPFRAEIVGKQVHLLNGNGHSVAKFGGQSVKLFRERAESVARELNEAQAWRDKANQEGHRADLLQVENARLVKLLGAATDAKVRLQDALLVCADVLEDIPQDDELMPQEPNSKDFYVSEAKRARVTLELTGLGPDHSEMRRRELAMEQTVSDERVAEVIRRVRLLLDGVFQHHATTLGDTHGLKRLADRVLDAIDQAVEPQVKRTHDEGTTL